jgi:flavin prenyltransferase
MRIIVAMTGATSAVYGVGLLAALRDRWAEVTFLKATRRSVREIAFAASVVHARNNQGAPILRHINELPSISAERGSLPREM